MSGTVSNQLATKLVFAAVTMGARPSDLLASAGLSAEVLHDPEGRFPIETLHALFDAAGRFDARFGLRAAQLTADVPNNVLAFAVHSSPTLEEAYLRVARYSAIINDTLSIRVERAGTEAWLVHEQQHPLGSHRQAVDLSLGILFHLGKQAGGDAFRASRVCFRHEALPDTSEHERFFGVVPSFGERKDALVIDAELLASPMPTASPLICAHLDRLLDEILRSLGTNDAFIDRVRSSIAAELRGGHPTIERIASVVSMSPRSLQRRLRDAGEPSFQEVRDEVRRELGEKYLARRELTLAEISFLLGFSEPSAFHRAFRRWTGTTPDEFRRSAVQKQPGSV